MIQLGWVHGRYWPPGREEIGSLRENGLRTPGGKGNHADTIIGASNWSASKKSFAPEHAKAATPLDEGRSSVSSHDVIFATSLDTETIRNVKVRSKTQTHGWWLRRYELNVENCHLKNAKRIIEHLERIVREEGIEHIILAGDELILSIIRQQLTPFLSSKIVDELKLDITAAEHEVLKATLAAMGEHEARTEPERARRMIDEFRAGGLAAVGVHDVLAALANGQVDTVFVSAALDQMHPGEEELHEAIAPAVKDLPPGTPMRITDAIVTRVHQTGARVEFIPDPALLAEVGGVGASLRYRL